jgi:hypothetical protein
MKAAKLSNFVIYSRKNTTMVHFSLSGSSKLVLIGRKSKSRNLIGRQFHSDCCYRQLVLFCFLFDSMIEKRAVFWVRFCNKKDSKRKLYFQKS